MLFSRRSLVTRTALQKRGVNQRDRQRNVTMRDFFTHFSAFTRDPSVFCIYQHCDTNPPEKIRARKAAWVDSRASSQPYWRRQRLQARIPLLTRFFVRNEKKSIKTTEQF